MSELREQLTSAPHQVHQVHGHGHVVSGVWISISLTHRAAGGVAVRATLRSVQQGDHATWNTRDGGVETMRWGGDRASRRGGSCKVVRRGDF